MDQKLPPVTNRVVAVNDLPLRDRDAPELYGDLCVNIHSFNGNVTFTIATCRLNVAAPNAGPAERVVSGRLTLPLAAVVDLHAQVGQVLANLRQQHAQQMILQASRPASVN